MVPLTGEGSVVGPEILGPILGFLVAGIGAVLFVFLVYRSMRLDSRPFALPTLAASLIAAACLNAIANHPGVMPFLCFFAVSSVVFGVHAHAIQLLGSLGRAPTPGVSRGDSPRRPPG